MRLAIGILKCLAEILVPPGLAGHFIGRLLQARLSVLGQFEWLVAFSQEVSSQDVSIDGCLDEGSVMACPLRNCKVLKALIHQLFRLLADSQAGPMAPESPGPASLIQRRITISDLNQPTLVVLFRSLSSEHGTFSDCTSIASHGN